LYYYSIIIILEDVLETESFSTGTEEGASVCASFSSLPIAIKAMRQHVMQFFRGFPESLGEIELAVGEACTNAVKYGSPAGANDTIQVKCTKDEHALVIEVSDSGPGFDPAALTPPCDELSESGMGIRLMRCMMDEVEFKFGYGTTVRMVKYRCHKSEALAQTPGLQLSAPVDIETP
jgi:anti-sigma regulatory factor (Ser/Thr protein kinase)